MNPGFSLTCVHRTLDGHLDYIHHRVTRLSIKVLRYDGIYSIPVGIRNFLTNDAKPFDLSQYKGRLFLMSSSVPQVNSQTQVYTYRNAMSYVSGDRIVYSLVFDFQAFKPSDGMVLNSMDFGQIRVYYEAKRARPCAKINKRSQNVFIEEPWALSEPMIPDHGWSEEAVSIAEDFVIIEPKDVDYGFIDLLV